MSVTRLMPHTCFRSRASRAPGNARCSLIRRKVTLPSAAVVSAPSAAVAWISLVGVRSLAWALARSSGRPPAGAAVTSALKAPLRQSPCMPQKSRRTPRTKPKSPMRFTTKAFIPAVAFLCSLYQKLISRYEQSPTPSQPTNISMKLSPRTSTSMANMKRFR